MYDYFHAAFDFSLIFSFFSQCDDDACTRWIVCCLWEEKKNERTRANSVRLWRLQHTKKAYNSTVWAHWTLVEERRESESSNLCTSKNISRIYASTHSCWWSALWTTRKHTTQSQSFQWKRRREAAAAATRERAEKTRKQEEGEEKYVVEYFSIDWMTTLLALSVLWHAEIWCISLSARRLPKRLHWRARESLPLESSARESSWPIAIVARAPSPLVRLIRKLAMSWLRRFTSLRCNKKTNRPKPCQRKHSEKANEIIIIGWVKGKSEKVSLASVCFCAGCVVVVRLWEAQECDSDFVEYRALRSFGDT